MTMPRLLRCRTIAGERLPRPRRKDQPGL